MDLRLIWFKKWLIFCFGLLFLYIILRFFEWFNGIIWIKKIKNKHLLIRRHDKFKKEYGNKISSNEMKKIINDSDFKKLAERPAWFELFERDKIIFFEIPWGEVYCECIGNEYKELVEYIDKKFIASIT